MMNGPPTQARFIVFQLAYKQIPAQAFKKGMVSKLLVLVSVLDLALVSV
jgi:hypothetical protein